MLKRILTGRNVRGLMRAALCACALVVACGMPARAQSPETASAQGRIERARSLAVVGNLTAAATELEAIRNETTDEAMRDVAGILLMGVYIKQSNYTRADAMLDASFKARAKEHEKTTRLYFTLAGQLINATRSRLDGYREFGLNPASAELPAEARTDVEQLRVLLERVVEQAKQISDENTAGGTRAGAQNMDATALIEDAAALRLTLARDVRERTEWQREVASVRQRLVGDGERAQKMRGATAVRVASAAPSSSAPNRTSNNNNVATPAAPSTAAPASTASPARADSSGAATTATPNASSPAPATVSQPTSNAARGTTSPPNANAKPLAVVSLVEKATQRVSPNYPAAARIQRVSGVVRVYVVVNEQGVVERVEPQSGPNVLQPAAADAARRWKFKPTVVDGQPVRVAGYISFNFAL